jgi:hypothetical protein
MAHDEITDVVVSARWSAYISASKGDTGARIKLRVPGRSLTAAETDELIRMQITATIRELLGTGKRVYLLYPVPEAERSVPAALAKLALRNLDYTRYSTASDDYATEHAFIRRVLDSIPDSPTLIRIDPGKALCNTIIPERCATYANGRVLYRDADHLSVAGADMVLETVYTQIAQERGSRGQ